MCVVCTYVWAQGEGMQDPLILLFMHVQNYYIIVYNYLFVIPFHFINLCCIINSLFFLIIAHIMKSYILIKKS